MRIFLEIQYIREFITLAKYGNYMVAAEELFISQSSLSKHIMALEKELGVSLFNRTTRKVQLTQLGKSFLPYAQRIADADTEFRGKLALMHRDAKDAIRLGVLPAFISYHMETGIVEFKRKFPQFPVSLVEGSNDMVLNWLRDGTCNVALIRSFEEPLPPDVTAIPLLRDCIALITITGSIFDDGRSSVSWKDLEKADLLTSTSLRQAQMLDTLMQRYNVHLNIISRLSRTPSIIEMLRRGVGNAALLNKVVSEYYQNECDLRILDITPTIYNTVSLVYMKDRPLSFAMRSFIDTVIPYVAKGEFAHG